MKKIKGIGRRQEKETNCEGGSVAVMVRTNSQCAKTNYYLELDAINNQTITSMSCKVDGSINAFVDTQMSMSNQMKSPSKILET